MDTEEIKRVFSLFKKDVFYKHSATFQEELNHQCNFVAVPIALVAIFSWLPYIRLDRNLDRFVDLVISLRLGFTLSGVIALILYFTPYFRKKGYILTFFVICYLEWSTGAILGLVSAHPAYMGGYAMLVLILPIIPFQKKHHVFILFSSLVIFVLVGFSTGMKFREWEELYGLYNLISASIVSLLAVFLLDNIRRANYEKSDLIHTTNEKLSNSALEIAQMNEELKKADKLKGKLLEIAAHDLKNPLQVIIGYTDLLQERLKDDSYSFEKLDVIYRSSDSMIKLISKLLKALTIDSGRLVLHKDQVDAGRLAEEIIENLRPRVDKKGQKIFFQSRHSCLLTADEMLLKEIFENLVGNAIKFSPGGASIWVEVDKCETAVTFKVKDEGPGLTDDDKEKLFVRFQKLSAEPTGDEPSTGLGLAITRDLVELHQGRIWVQSEYGRGSTFVVELPAG